MAPIRLFISAGGSHHFCPGLSRRVFSVASLGILMLDVCGGWWLDQFRSPRGTCKLKQKSWLHFAGVPLLFCPPEVHCANSHDLFQLTLHLPASNTSTSLLKLNWPFRNVHKLPPLQQPGLPNNGSLYLLPSFFNQHWKFGPKVNQFCHCFKRQTVGFANNFDVFFIIFVFILLPFHIL